MHAFSVPGNICLGRGPPSGGGGPRSGGPRDTPGGGGPSNLVPCGDDWGPNDGGGAGRPDPEELRLCPPGFGGPETT